MLLPPAVLVEQQGLIRPLPFGLLLGERRAEIIEGLDRDILHVGAGATIARRDHAQPLRSLLSTVEADLGHDAHHRRLLAGRGIDAERALTARDQQANVGVLLSERGHGLLHDARSSSSIERQLEPEVSRAEFESRQVLIQSKDSPCAHADPLEQAVTIQESVIQHRDLRFTFGYQLPVDRNCLFPRFTTFPCKLRETRSATPQVTSMATFSCAPLSRAAGPAQVTQPKSSSFERMGAATTVSPGSHSASFTS